MAQEEVGLLLRDLSGRLPYNVVVQVSYKDVEGWKTEDRKVLGVYADEQVYVDGVYIDIENIKPYLRPMSSMSKEKDKEYLNIDNRSYSCPIDYAHIPAQERIDWLNENHFDYRGLIEKGLAIEVTKENNPYEN